ncbi:MAG: hypothetical protein L6R39_001107 [Caloplaca ligustica]|nr:MAG: hypothetical protein L6R39_001107 [Caloplaca ligustica]
MASIHERIPWHEGESMMQQKLHIPPQENPTNPFLTPSGAYLIQHSPLLALGTLDDKGRPWTTLLGGKAGFARPLGHSVMGIRTMVDPSYDPVINSLLASNDGDESVEQADKYRAVSALTIDLATRSRYKLAGSMVAGALGQLGDASGSGQEHQASPTEAQIVIKIERSLGNCPKYINKKQIIPTIPEPALVSGTLPLSAEAIELLAKADLFFVTSSYDGSSMGTNNRGGPRGFVRVMQNDFSGTTLVYPEYSGNRLYQTLGNLCVFPKVGIVVPDFDTGNVLYTTGTTEIVLGRDCAAILPRSNLAVKVHLEKARFVRHGLAVKAQPGEPSPYNPPVRFLATERAGSDAQAANRQVVYAKLIKKELLTPSIGRFRFSVSDPEVAGRIEPGQYVALAFEDELGTGYSHMRDDDPMSLNDDLIRTFTVSSSMQGNLPQDEFEITIRNVGKVTKFLFRQNVKAGIEVPIQGFAGTFVIRQPDGEVVPFVAGGIGITPLLAQLPDLDLGRIKLLWTINNKDIGLVLDSFDRCPQLARSTTVFVSGAADAAVRGQELQTMPRLEQYGAQVLPRRMVGSDIQGLQGLSTTWYICAGSALRQALLSWLPGKKVVYEDFDY